MMGDWCIFATRSSSVFFHGRVAQLDRALASEERIFPPSIVSTSFSITDSYPFYSVSLHVANEDIVKIYPHCNAF